MKLVRFHAGDRVKPEVLVDDAEAFQLERGGQWVKGKSCETFNPLGAQVLELWRRS